MQAFEVHLNGKRLCKAGIDRDSVLSATVNAVSREDSHDLFRPVSAIPVDLPLADPGSDQRRPWRLGYIEREDFSSYEIHSPVRQLGCHLCPVTGL